MTEKISANAIITHRQSQVAPEDHPDLRDAVALLAAGCLPESEADEAVGIVLATTDPVLLLPIVAGVAHDLGRRLFGDVEEFARQLARWQAGLEVEWPERAL